MATLSYLPAVDNWVVQQHLPVAHAAGGTAARVAAGTAAVATCTAASAEGTWGSAGRRGSAGTSHWRECPPWFAEAAAS